VNGSLQPSNVAERVEVSSAARAIQNRMRVGRVIGWRAVRELRFFDAATLTQASRAVAGARRPH